MFTKIHIAFYNLLFWFYGVIGQRYYHKSLAVDDELDKIRLKQKAWRCFDKREDIFDIIFVLKGLS